MKKGIVVIVASALAAAGAGWLLTGRGTPEAGAASERSGVKYFCPMHPAIVRDEPGQCPICRMDLQAMEEEGSPHPHPLPAPRGEGEQRPTHAPFTLSAERRQLIGVTRDVVARRRLEHVLRVPGRIAFDPDLYSAIEEYRQARSGRELGSQDASTMARSLVRSAETRLRVLGLSDDQISALSESDRPPTELLFGRKGGSVWLYADVYQSEIPLVKTGQAVEARTNAAPGKVFRGKVRAVDAVVNPVTRTARVRALLENPEGQLKPEVYLDVRILVPMGERLAAPQDAVLDSGESQWAFVIDGDRIEPRQVRVGRRGEGFVEVLEGLKEGELVVTSANFLIDSESRLRSAVSAFGGAHAGHGDKK